MITVRLSRFKMGRATNFDIEVQLRSDLTPINKIPKFYPWDGRTRGGVIRAHRFGVSLKY